MNKISQTKKFIRQTFINGIICLIPIVALTWIFYNAVSGFFPMFQSMQHNEMVKKLGGPLLLAVLCIAFVIVLIFLIGILIHFTFLQKFNGWLERQLLAIIPGYEFYKKMMEERLHAKQSEGRPVIVQWKESQQPGIQIEENKNDTVTVYFPHSTLTGGGAVHIVAKTQVTHLDITLTEMDEILNRFGAGLGMHCKPRQ